MSNLLVVSIFGREGVSLKSEEDVPNFEATELDCRCYSSDNDVLSVLSRDNPGMIVTFGDESDYQGLMEAPYEVRRKWVNFPNGSDLKTVGKVVFETFVTRVCMGKQDVPLVSVFTPTYMTGDMLRRPYLSLLSQTYTNWEWVVIDDSEDGKTFDALSEMASNDCRVRPYRADRHSGNIGALKRDACSLSRGEFLVELDHDDELTPWALGNVTRAYEKFPEAGFVYTDFAECFGDGTPVRYGGGWGFGYGSYRDESFNGQDYAVVNSPNVNPKTIRHIVAAPNHIRSWRKSTYEKLGGHNPDMSVADDYELLVRTFLETRMARVPSMCYVQYRNQGGNTHQSRNKEIHRLVRYISMMMDGKIHDRFLELGVDDFVWEDGTYSFCRLNIPNQETESHCTLTLSE